MLYGMSRKAGRKMEIKTKSLKNGIIGMLTNVKERREELE
jgi:ribosomal protein S17E